MQREIIPACMPQNVDEIRERAALASSQAMTMQLDLMDGKYVPEKTWPFFHVHDFQLEKIKNSESALPFWDTLNYELDLMVEKPEERLSDWLALAPSRIIFHLASVADWKKIQDFSQQTASFIELGLAVTIHDNLAFVQEKMDLLDWDFVQIMGINHIGYSGEPFDERSFELVRWFQERYPETPLSFDGGVSEDTIPVLAEAGVSRFVSGSRIFNHGIPEENILFLQELANREVL